MSAVDESKTEFHLEVTLLLTKYSLKLMNIIDKIFRSCLNYYYQDKIKQYRSLLDYLRYRPGFDELSFHLNRIRVIYNGARHSGLRHYDIENLNDSLDKLLPMASLMKQSCDKENFYQLVKDFQDDLSLICQKYQFRVSGRKNFSIEDFIKGKKRTPLFST